MKNLVLSLGCLTMLASCQEITPAPAPVSDFTFRGAKAAEQNLTTNDTCSLFSAVQHATSLSWDFGNGITSNAKRPVLSYDKSGTYTVTLTATGADGQRSSVSKKVEVLDMVLKRLVIDKAYWSLVPLQNFNATWPTTEYADVFVQIQQLQATSTFPPGGLVPNAPVVFKSAIAPNVFRNTVTPMVVEVPGRVVLELPKLSRGNTWANTYLVSLLAQNQHGTYCLFSNMFSGSGQSFKTDGVKRGNTLTYSTSLFSQVRMEFQFE
ncbi:PKD domain-containing protein [Hymenobacter fodinae]|uniref:PKD domain-containing protein n=1 Tax=Hymenobacter fodinae TaxID=2510796 RepID=A0A4Z0PA45_9BACT|nr:PKD domain-containing protein [Hymenobacter fodinae]TGE09475.1 PKD domain-containing protein [Hymenobacter fodinae]